MKKAFTLAEVLIVLAIIGVVASITIPALMQKTQNQEYVTALKKFYGEANQALALTAIDEGTPGKIGVGSGTIADRQQLASDIAAHFKKSKDCKFSTTDNCWAIYNTNYDGSGSTKDWNTFSDNNYYKFVTADGMSVFLQIFVSDCLSPNPNSKPDDPTFNYCGDLYVDVNGLKKPNILGRDVFIFRITSNKAPILYPVGGKEDDYYWNGPTKYCQATHNAGDRCAGRIMEEGWQMNY